MQTITIDNITYNLVPVETPLVPVDHKKPRYAMYYSGNDDDVYPIVDDQDETDNFFYTTHNYFKTEQEATQYRDYLLALGRINHRIFQLNEGWKANWSTDDMKYSPYFTHRDNFGHIDGWTHNNKMSIFTPAKSIEILNTLFVEMAIDLETVRVWMMR